MQITMDIVAIAVIAVFVGIVVARQVSKRRLARRQQYIDEYVFPLRIKKKLAQVYPHLGPQQVERVMCGLREYFHVCNLAGQRMVSMPSQVVDVAWHEFILFTRQYEEFCQQGLGRFLHHTPAEAMKTPTLAQEGIKRAWRLSCFREGMKPAAATALPLLFAIDTELAIADGFRYSLDCRQSGGEYCAGHIGCSSGCGGDSAGSDSGGDSGCGGGCGGGD